MAQWSKPQNGKWTEEDSFAPSDARRWRFVHVSTRDRLACASKRGETHFEQGCLASFEGGLVHILLTLRRMSKKQMKKVMTPAPNPTARLTQTVPIHETRKIKTALPRECAKSRMSFISDSLPEEYLRLPPPARPVAPMGCHRAARHCRESRCVCAWSSRGDCCASKVWATSGRWRS